MVDPLKIFWVLTNSTYLGKYSLNNKIDDNQKKRTRKR